MLPLRAADFAEDLRPLDFEELFPLAARRPLAFAPREPLLAARELRDLPALFEAALDFLARADFAPARLLPLGDFFAPAAFRPPEEDDFFAREDLRPPLFLLEDDLLEPIPVARLAAPAAWLAARLTAAFALATFAGLLAALPVIAPMSPPTTAPTGPATLPTTAPAAAPAVVLEIDGTSRLSEEELPDDC